MPSMYHSLQCSRAYIICILWHSENPYHTVHCMRSLDRIIWYTVTYLPDLHSSVTDYCRSCTTCSCSKSKHHKPYRLLLQLPIPVRPWDSISMDFIKQLPPSSDGFTAILVVVDHFTKQFIFIPMHDTITSA